MRGVGSGVSEKHSGQSNKSDYQPLASKSANIRRVRAAGRVSDSDLWFCGDNVLWFRSWRYLRHSRTDNPYQKLKQGIEVSEYCVKNMDMDEKRADKVHIVCFACTYNLPRER